MALRPFAGPLKPEDPMPSDADVSTILAKRHDNGADYWATTDGRIVG